MSFFGIGKIFFDGCWLNLFLFQNAFFFYLKRGHSIDETDELGRTCLHIASSVGSLPIVPYLIEKGANIEAKDYDQWTPLYYACSKGYLQIA